MIEKENLTSEELDIYHSLLSESYPAPKTDIHANVMKQIRGERLLQKKRAQRAAFVKWGSIAAVVAIACLIGFRAMPEVNDFAPMARNGMAEDYAIISYDADGVDNSWSAGCVVEDESADISYGMNGETTPAYSAATKDDSEEIKEPEETEATEEAVETEPVAN